MQSYRVSGLILREFLTRNYICVNPVLNLPASTWRSREIPKRRSNLKAVVDVVSLATPSAVLLDALVGLSYLSAPTTIKSGNDRPRRTLQWSKPKSDGKEWEWQNYGL